MCFHQCFSSGCILARVDFHHRLFFIRVGIFNRVGFHQGVLTRVGFYAFSSGWVYSSGLAFIRGSIAQTSAVSLSLWF